MSVSALSCNWEALLAGGLRTNFKEAEGQLRAAGTLQEEEKQRKKRRKADTKGKSLNEVLPAPKNASSTMGMLGAGTGSVSYLVDWMHSNAICSVSHQAVASIAMAFCRCTAGMRAWQWVCWRAVLAFSHLEIFPSPAHQCLYYWQRQQLLLQANTDDGNCSPSTMP